MMEAQDLVVNGGGNSENHKNHKFKNDDVQTMTSSTISGNSSLNSPVEDSGVQLLDSESEITASFMSFSGTDVNLENDCAILKRDNSVNSVSNLDRDSHHGSGKDRTISCKEVSNRCTEPTNYVSGLEKNSVLERRESEEISSHIASNFEPKDSHQVEIEERLDGTRQISTDSENSSVSRRDESEDSLSPVSDPVEVSKTDSSSFKEIPSHWGEPRFDSYVAMLKQDQSNRFRDFTHSKIDIVASEKQSSKDILSVYSKQPNLDSNKVILRQQGSPFKNSNRARESCMYQYYDNRTKDTTFWAEKDDLKQVPLSTSVPNYFDKFEMATQMFSSNLEKSKKDALNQSLSDEVFEMEHPIRIANETGQTPDLMNVSLNSYELLDYTLQNKNLTGVDTGPASDQIMHVSMSEEVNENLKIAAPVATEPLVLPIMEDIPAKENVVKPPVEEQIVFRRQRKKKSKSDTPKKRVSFHEDILNSTKIDDVHINHGFITHEPDVSLSFFQRGFVRRPDVVKGRYSWAAEGDAPYYEKAPTEREIKSDLYINNHNSRFSSSTSSSSTGSISSSIDEEDNNNSEENSSAKKEPSLAKQPKSSCLKKTKHTRKHIDTKIVHEEIKCNRKKKSESNLLDGANIFGSLKNILNFSSSVPLGDRGVPEGQEDVAIYSTSHELNAKNRRKSCTNLTFKGFIEPIEIVQPEEVKTVVETVNSKFPQNSGKNNLKFAASEGFYPNYPTTNQVLPANIILCDSNVYEHKGISYSYEYDKFQKTFEQQSKPKSSTVYQMILKEFNFFRKKAKEQPADDETLGQDFEVIPSCSNDTSSGSVLAKSDSIEEVEEPEVKSPRNSMILPNKYGASSTKLDWSDNDTIISDLSETLNSALASGGRHLNSPKRRVNRNNHYSLSPFKVAPGAQNTPENTNVPKSSDNNLEAVSAMTSKSLPNNFNNSTNNASSNNAKPGSGATAGSVSSKTSLINRFLRNVTLKKMLDMKAQNKQKNCRKYMGLYVKGVKFRYEGPDECDKALEREILKGRQSLAAKQETSKTADKKFIVQLKKEIFRSRLEKLLGAFPVRSAYATNGHSRPLMVILTDSTLYIAGTKPHNFSSSCSSSGSYCNHFVLPYTELNTILIGPNAQTVYFSNYDKDMQCMIVTGCAKITSELVGQIEIGMRRDMNKPGLAAVKQLGMRDMANLRRAICKQTSVDKDEEYFYYSIVNIQDFNPELAELTPMGPNKEGPLMFKTSDTEARWETAYFILKAGVLYMLSSASQRVPMRVFPLINGSCQGARRIFNCPRPHTFQLIVENKPLHLAAPDEYVASDWLQCLVHAASGGYNYREKNPTQSCSLLMTSDHILTVREALPCTMSSLLPAKRDQHEPIKGAQVLSCAAIMDLTAFRLPSAEQSWCILEFSCREVHECSGDWILYFATNAELETFISTMEVLWNYNNDTDDSFPLSTIPETDPLSKKCVDVYTTLKSSWPSNTVHLQFL